MLFFILRLMIVYESGFLLHILELGNPSFSPVSLFATSF